MKGLSMAMIDCIGHQILSPPKNSLHGCDFTMFRINQKDTAYWYWKAVVHSAPGVQDGWFGSSTRAINGAVECQGYNGDLARARYQKYAVVFTEWNLVGGPVESGCYN
jgi:hypothetical protein